MAIAIPVFTKQLEKSREATDISNVRAAYAEAMTSYLEANAPESVTATASARQRQESWQGAQGELVARVNGVEASVPFSAKISGSAYTVHVSNSGSGASVWVD